MEDADPEPGADPPSVAVLPFVNMSADPDNEYFSDGISEELLNLLVRIEGLRVPSRTSSFAFKGMNTDIRDIARQLEVGHILEGSVRKAGNRVRITAQLIDVSSDTHLWSDTYDRELEDIFTIQEEISTHIVEALKLVLAPGAVNQAPTGNLEAYNLFLQGRHLFQKRQHHVRDAEMLLLKAVELDPDFAEAWAVLAMTYIVFPNYLGMDSTEVHPKSQAAAERALSINPDLAEPKLAMAQIASRDYRWERSLALYEEVLEDHPRLAIARLWNGITLLQAGYASEALLQFRRAVDLDPVAGINHDWLARTYLVVSRTGEVPEIALKAVGLGRPGGNMPLLHYALLTGDAGPLEQSLELYPDRFQSYWPLALRYGQGAASATEFQDWIDQQEAKDNINISRYGRLYMSNIDEDPERFMQALRDVVGFDDSVLSSLWLPMFHWFRQHPVSKEFFTEVGWLDLWRSRGWPDLCRPLGEDDFECE